MNISIPKEIKDMERRVALTPSLVQKLRLEGHSIYVASGAGQACGHTDSDYHSVGATIVSNEKAYNIADLVVKVKEPLAHEVHQMQSGATVFSYLHLAAALETKEALKNQGVRGIPFEGIQGDDGGFPLLKPMSEIAGRLAAIEAEDILLKNKGRKMDHAKVLVIGGGVAGTAAALACECRGAKVSVIDKSDEAIARLNALSITAYQSPSDDFLKQILRDVDVLIGAVLIPGKEAPKVINATHIKEMEEGGVFVDIAIDQGGCSTTSRPTTHSNPTYDKYSVTHYCVTNMPGKAYRDATDVLSNAIFPYVKLLAHDEYALEHFREV